MKRFLVGMLVALGIAWLPSILFAAELVTAEIEGTDNLVVVAQGDSANFEIRLSATGSIKCAATAADPATARVHTSFELTSGTLTSGTFSPAFNFFGGSAIGGPNCSITWTGAPAAYTQAASVSADCDTEPGNYNILLSTAAGTTQVTNPGGSGGSLEDTTATTVVVQVVEGDCAPTDTTAPTTTIVLTPSSPDGDNGWYVSDVHVLVSATDDTDASPEIRCQLDGTAPATFDNLAAGCAYTSPGANVTTDGNHTVYAASKDASDNKSTVVSATFKIDQTDPAVTITTPANNGSYVLGSVVNADYECTDSTSGIASCTGPVADGAAIDTSSVGAKSFKVDAKDNAGNTNSATNNYSVVYGVCVLYDQTKSHKAGSTVPIKIQLCDANGVNVSDADVVVQAYQLKRVDGTASGAVEDSGNANQPEYDFRYDAELEGYIFNLSTKSPSPALGAGTTKLSVGTWKLCFTVDDVSSTSYCVTFDVK